MGLLFVIVIKINVLCLIIKLITLVWVRLKIEKENKNYFKKNDEKSIPTFVNCSLAIFKNKYKRSDEKKQSK